MAMGGRQRWALAMLRGDDDRGRGWHPTCGPFWTTPSRTRAILDSLAQEGLVERFAPDNVRADEGPGYRLSDAGRRATGVDADPVTAVVRCRPRRDAPERARRRAPIGRVDVVRDGDGYLVRWRAEGADYAAACGEDLDPGGTLRRRLDGDARTRGVSLARPGNASMWEEARVLAGEVLERRRSEAAGSAMPLLRALEDLVAGRPGARREADDLIARLAPRRLAETHGFL